MIHSFSLAVLFTNSVPV